MRFRSTSDILKGFDEIFDPNWSNSPVPVYPPRKDWDYSRELQIEDVDIWEVIYEESGGIGLYAAWLPYAEFYMILCGWDSAPGHQIETYYGKGALSRVKKRVKDLNMLVYEHPFWVEDDKMYLYIDD